MKLGPTWQGGTAKRSSGDEGVDTRVIELLTFCHA